MVQKIKWEIKKEEIKKFIYLIKAKNLLKNKKAVSNRAFEIALCKTESSLKFCDAELTNILLFELGETFAASAEVANGNILGENNLVTLDIYLYRVGVRNSKLPANLFRYNYSAKLINISYNTG